MKTVEECMARGAPTANPDQSLKEVAATMKARNVGLLPVEENGKIVGVVTDRDLVTRGLASDGEFQAMRARDAMTSPVACAHADDTVDYAAQLMREKGINRLPVLDHAERYVGVLSVASLAAQGEAHLAGRTLGQVMAPRLENEVPLMV